MHLKGLGDPSLSQHLKDVGDLWEMLQELKTTSYNGNPVGIFPIISSGGWLRQRKLPASTKQRERHLQDIFCPSHLSAAVL
jgi:hypothetical protein